MIKNTNSKMTRNSQLSTTEQKQKQTKQTRKGTESQKWRSHEKLSLERCREVIGGKFTGKENKMSLCIIY